MCKIGRADLIYVYLQSLEPCQREPEQQQQHDLRNLVACSNNGRTGQHSGKISFFLSYLFPWALCDAVLGSRYQPGVLASTRSWRRLPPFAPANGVHHPLFVSLSRQTIKSLQILSTPHIHRLPYYQSPCTSPFSTHTLFSSSSLFSTTWRPH